MESIKEIATAFSGGKFFEVEHLISENVEWHIYEENIHLHGRQAVMDFCRSVTKYFESVTTKFEMAGLMTGDDKVAIYGQAEFIRQGKLVNSVHSCDIYEFTDEGGILRIYSYCNSKREE